MQRTRQMRLNFKLISKHLLWTQTASCKAPIPVVFQQSINNVRYNSSRASNSRDDNFDEIGPGIENPLRRAGRIFKEDMKNVAKGRFHIPDSEFFPKFADVVIIGGGVVGSSIAFWLKRRAERGLNVVVVEKDPTYALSSTALSVGGIRQQFSLPENIQMSMFGAEFLRDIKKHLSVQDMEDPDVQFQPQGYLLLASESGVATLKENHEIQRDLGARVDLLTARQLKQTFPWLNTDKVAMGSYGYGSEGWFDPYLLLMAFKRKAMALGVRYVQGEVTGMGLRHIRDVNVFDDDGVQSPFKQIRQLTVKLENGEMETINPATVVVAAGPQSGAVGRLAEIGDGGGTMGKPIPVEPRKRYVYVVDCQDGPGIDCPLLIDSTGAYFRRVGLGTTYICGKSPSNAMEPDSSNLEIDYSFFENEVWPILAHRIPSFECLKMKNAWAGYYDYNTFDQNAIIGYHPNFPNLIVAAGFSGHGIQQAPAVGRAVMEMIIYNNFKTIDLSRFSFERIISKEPVYERNII